MTSESTTPAGRPKRHWLPQLKSRWWTLLLGLSLMVNLLIGGLAIGFRMGDGPVERIAGITYIQLIPRSFLGELPRERRDQLMDIVRSRSQELRALRSQSRAAPLKLADALEMQTYDPAAVKTAIDAFTTGSGSLAAGGGNVVMEIVGQLTPEERQLLATAIRDRAERGDRRKRN